MDETPSRCWSETGAGAVKVDHANAPATDAVAGADDWPEAEAEEDEVRPDAESACTCDAGRASSRELCAGVGALLAEAEAESER